GSILLHDNARPHVTSTTVQKLHQLGTEILLCPLYSPDLTISSHKSDSENWRILKTPVSSFFLYASCNTLAKVYRTLWKLF
ncbi:Histone-lysine N-methyltransferase SETMAR, partial [Habropoda laboriosa]